MCKEYCGYETNVVTINLEKPLITESGYNMHEVMLMDQNRELIELLKETREIWHEYERRLKEIWGIEESPYACARGWIEPRLQILLPRIDEILKECDNE